MLREAEPSSQKRVSFPKPVNGVEFRLRRVEWAKVVRRSIIEAVWAGPVVSPKNDHEAISFAFPMLAACVTFEL